MKTYNPPHDVTDSAKLASMIETIRTGGELPPVVVCGDMAFSGSHRIEAYRQAYRLANACVDGSWDEVDVGSVPAVEVSDECYCRACELAEVSPGDHDQIEWNVFVRHLRNAAIELDETNVADALADQTDKHYEAT